MSDATPMGLGICCGETQGRPLFRRPTLGLGTQSLWDWGGGGRGFFRFPGRGNGGMVVEIWRCFGGGWGCWYGGQGRDALATAGWMAEETTWYHATASEHC
jgi:hypothetical protein